MFPVSAYLVALATYLSAKFSCSALAVYVEVENYCFLVKNILFLHDISIEIATLLLIKSS